MKAEVIDFFLNDLKGSFDLEFSSTPVILSMARKRVVICGESAIVSNVSSSQIDIENSSNRGRYTPDIDQLFLSAVKLCKNFDVYASLMTGIGDDGVNGLLELKKNGAVTIAESEDSAPVFGMPRCAIEHNAANHIFNLDEMITFFASEGLIDV
jgi:two-component system chemotaxis response regulator CheB